MTDESQSTPSVEEVKSTPQGDDPSQPTGEVAEIAVLKELEDLDGFYSPMTPSPSLKELIQSSDSPSRYLALLSVVFALLALFCMSLLALKYIDYRHRHAQTKILNNHEDLGIIFTQELGEFRVAWKNLEMRGDITAQCSNAETCKQLKTRLNEVRDHVLVILQESSGEAVLNPEQKSVVRRRILDQLNEMPLSGRVTEINFTDLVVEPIHQR